MTLNRELGNCAFLGLEETERTFAGNRLGESTRLLKDPVPAAGDCPFALRVLDAIHNLDGAQDNAPVQLVRVESKFGHNVELGALHF